MGFEQEWGSGIIGQKDRENGSKHRRAAIVRRPYSTNLSASPRNAEFCPSQRLSELGYRSHSASSSGRGWRWRPGRSGSLKIKTRFWARNVFSKMETVSLPSAGAGVAATVAPRSGWRNRVRTWLRPTNWSATPEAARVPRWVHVVLWLWLLLTRRAQAQQRLSMLPRLPATAAEWQLATAPAGPAAGRRCLRRYASST